MSNVDEHWENWVEYPQGRKLPSAPKGQFGTIRAFPAADDEHLRLARRHWQEREPDDFIRSGKSFTERATGITYRRAHGNPFAGDSSTNVVDCFFIQDDEFTFLRRQDSDRTSHSVIGEVGRIEA